MAVRKKQGKQTERTEVPPAMEGMAEILACIHRIQDNADRIHKIQDRILTSAFETHDLESNRGALVSENRQLFGKVRNMIKAHETKMDGMSDTERRMKWQSLQSQSKKLYDVWGKFNQDQIDYRDRSKKLFIRRVKVIDANVEDEDVDRMLDKGNSQVFIGDFLEEERIAKNQLTELENRHQEIAQLERDIVDLNGMFIEVATLIENQGEQIDSIERSVELGRENIESGKKELRKAKEWKSKLRKSKFCLGGIVITILVIVVLAVVLPLVVNRD